MREHDLTIIGKQHILKYRKNPYEMEGYPYIYRIYKGNQTVFRKELRYRKTAQQLRKILMEYEKEKGL